MITFSEVPIGDGGVLSCTRCASSPKAVPHPVEAIMADIETVTVREYGRAPNVLFTSFEPFKHPALPTLITAARDQGAERIMLRTDGGALGVGGNAEGCLTAGVRMLEIVVLAEGERHDRLAGRPGLFSTLEAGVARFSEAATAAGVNVAVFGILPVCKHNVAELPATVAAIARLGAVAVRIDAAALKASEANAALLKAALDTATVNRVAAHVGGVASELPLPYRVAPYNVTGSCA